MWRVTWHACSELPPPRKPRVNNGFTLAEVLITLGVIGVVSALTIPTIISNIQDKQHRAKWKKEFSVIQNAYRLVLDEGIDVTKDRPYGNWFTDEFINSIRDKLNVIDSCNDGIHECDYYNYPSDWQQKRCKYKWSGVANVYSRYKALGSTINTGTYSSHGVSAYNFGSPALLLNDGAVIYFGGTHGGPWIVVDVNNFTQGPNEFGRDVFVIRAVTSNNRTDLKPMGAEGTFNKDANGDTCECSKDKGRKNGPYIADLGGSGEVISGACCSSKYLME